MTDYWDVGTFKKTQSGKSFFVRLGRAQQSDDGGFRLYLDALPAPQDGQYVMNVTKPREKRGSDEPPL